MRYAYVGCRTTKERNARGEGLKTYEIQPDGSWKCLQCLETEPNPSFQTLDGEGKYLYSVHGDITKVSSYRILKDHTLEHINTIDIGGRNPVDITVDRNNKHVIVATFTLFGDGHFFLRKQRCDFFRRSFRNAAVILEGQAAVQQR